jgi:galactose mutarotase-like enzyme
MPQHGFARRAPFSLVESGRDRALLRLVESAQTRAHYPFRFALDVEARLTPDMLSYAFTVTNTDETDLPYAIGFHPAFLWPFDGGECADYRVLFENAESARIPAVTDAALLVLEGGTAPLDGRSLALDPAMFTDALVFLDARSRSLSFEAPSRAAIVMTTEAFPHLAIWTRPTAPFLSLEAWTGHADWHGFSGELADRASMRILKPGESARQAVSLAWREPALR